MDDAFHGQGCRQPRDRSHPERQPGTCDTRPGQERGLPPGEPANSPVWFDADPVLLEPTVGPRCQPTRSDSQQRNGHPGDESRPREGTPEHTDQRNPDPDDAEAEQDSRKHRAEPGGGDSRTRAHRSFTPTSESNSTSSSTVRSAILPHPGRHPSGSSSSHGTNTNERS